MKKNLENNVSENVVIESIMSEKQMQAYITENESIIPACQRKKYNALTDAGKVAKIRFYYDLQKMREDARIKNSVTMKVKELFEKRGSVEDAKAVMKYCQEYIDGYKQREIDEINNQIAALEEKKKMLA